LITQIINLSEYEYFKTYSKKYGIYREVYSNGLLGLELRNIKSKLAAEIKKLILKENEICYKSADLSNNMVNLFITGSISTFKRVSRNILSNWDEDLGYKINNIIKNFEEYGWQKYKIGDKVFNFEKSYVMGILNVTPDSFSDGGMYLDKSEAVKYGLQMIEEGSDILDIGGESTRPNAEPVSQEEEINRVIPVIKEILVKNKNAVISVDTSKSVVADEALKSGAKIINDISGLPAPAASNPGPRSGNRPTQSARGLDALQDAGASGQSFCASETLWSAVTRHRFGTTRHVASFQSADMSAHPKLQMRLRRFVRAEQCSALRVLA